MAFGSLFGGGLPCYAGLQLARNGTGARSASSLESYTSAAPAVSRGRCRQVGSRAVVRCGLWAFMAGTGATGSWVRDSMIATTIAILALPSVVDGGTCWSEGDRRYATGCCGFAGAGLDSRSRSLPPGRHRLSGARGKRPPRPRRRRRALVAAVPPAAAHPESACGPA